LAQAREISLLAFPSSEIRSTGSATTMCNAVVCTPFLGALAVVAALLVSGWHTVPEGHVGAYWRLGRLLPDVTTPGIHFRLPLVVRWEPIQVTMQTDAVLSIPCGTKGGAMIAFGRVEVVNRLRKEAVYDILSQYGTQYDKTWIYDKVHHEINQFCSAHSLQEIYIDRFNEIDEIMQQALQEGCRVYAPGIDIIAVRVTKPSIPHAVLRNYEAMEEERTKVMVSEQHRRLVSIEAETLRQKLVSEAETKLNVTRIENAIKLEERKAEADAQSYRAKAEADAESYRLLKQADAESYRQLKQAEGNAQLFTQEYLALRWADAISNTTKVYFGPSLGGLSSGIMQAADAVISAMSGGRPATCSEQGVCSD